MSDAANPTTIGSLIDQLYATRSLRLEVEKTVKNYKTQEAALRIQIIRTLGDIGLDGGKGTTATAAIVKDVVPRVDDWDKVYEYIETHEAFEIMQRRVSATAIRDRWDAGEDIPGIEKVETVDLSLTKRSK